MAKTHPSWTVDTTFSAKNIASAASVYAFTAAADARVSFTVKLTNAAGGGDYVVYLTHDWLGGSAAATVLPKSTCPAAAGETKIEFVTIPVDVKATDVINVMVDGLAGDTSVNGAIRIVADNPSVFEASDTVSTVSTVTTVSGGTINSVSGTVSANMVQINGDADLPGNLAMTGADSDTLKSLSDQLDLIGGSLGLYTDTVTVRVNGLPVDGALVQVATDSLFANIVRSGYTNSLGQVTFQYDSVGTYYGRAELAGYNIATFTITVSA